jgi:molecular chaperone GrpE
MDERVTNGEIDEPSAGQPQDGAARADVTPGAGEGVGSGVVETLREEVARKTEEAERNWQQFLRAAADLENYRKQAVRQREDAVASTRRAMLSVILGVVDTLERALQHAGEAVNGPNGGPGAAIVEGIRLAHRQVLDTLRTLGVRAMDSVGHPFDPRVHEAVDAAPAGGTTPPGTVVGEIQRGYLIGDDVLRPARVRVAQ